MSDSLEEEEEESDSIGMVTKITTNPSVIRYDGATSMIGSPANRDEMIVMWYNQSTSQHILGKVSLRDGVCREIYETSQNQENQVIFCSIIWKNTK